MNEQEQFVVEYLEKKPGGGGIDICNSDFVEDYIEKFSPPFRPTMYGAHKCPKLGRLLTSMYRKGLLERSRVGLPGMGRDFPNWVYHYVIPYWKRNS